MNPVIIVAAILPIVVALTDRGDSGFAVALDLVSWGIFLTDYVVHVRLKPGFVRSKAGIFDLTIVVLTVPWYLLPPLDDTRILTLARLGRLGRIFLLSSKGSLLRQLGQRLGLAAAYAATLILCCAGVVRYTEPPSSGFDSFGDSVWWSMVTFSTVGYGDLVPVTTAGRISAVLLMLGGIALVGALAGSLGAFFTRTDIAEDAVGGSPDEESDDDPVLRELRSLREEVATLREQLDLTDRPSGEAG